MVSKKNLAVFLVIFFGIPNAVNANDVLLELKAAYFRATGSQFKNIYGKGAGLYGPELTFQLCDSNWYGFLSADFLHKKGHSIGLNTPTSIRLVPVGIGVKYFMPTCNECANFYLGLGFQPVHVRIQNNSQFVPNQKKWVLGGIAKLGTYIYFSCNWFIDLFIDYSFAHISAKSTQAQPIVPLSSSISGAIFGIGIGYRF